MAKVKPQAIKLIVTIVFACAVAVFGYTQYQKGKLIAHENRAVAHFNADEYDKAISEYESLLPKLSAGETRQRVTVQLGKCWKAKSEDYSLTLKQQLEYARKALEYDPNAITNPQILSALKNKM
jgi:tetratricopeptide (TPR) repeat protein